MRFFNVVLAILATSSGLMSCEKEDSIDRVKEVEMTIYPEIGYGAPIMSEILSEVMIFSETDNPEKQQLSNIITEDFDFDYQIGHQYTFKAQKIWMNNPPQDVSSIKYKKVGSVEIKKQVTNDFTESMTMTLKPSKVSFVPRFTQTNTAENSQPVMALEGFDQTAKKRWVMTQIEGLDYQEGYTYSIRIERKVKANPYKEQFVLLEVLNKEKTN